MDATQVHALIARATVSLIPGKGEITEDQQGYNFIEAAQATKLPFLVFTSVSDATPTCGVPHFETKAKIELALKDSGIPHAVVAPVAFFDNFTRKHSWANFGGMGFFEAALKGKAIQMVAVDDIGAPSFPSVEHSRASKLKWTPASPRPQGTSPLACSPIRIPTTVNESSSPATRSR